MTLTEIVRNSEEVRELGEDAIILRYKGIWYLVDLERKTITKLSSVEDLKILVGGV